MLLNECNMEMVLEVLKVEIFGESGYKNIMRMFQTNPSLSCDGSLSSEGINALLNVKENSDKILMWETHL